jgi:hypothetical protein
MERTSEFCPYKLKMRHIASKYLPRLISYDQKEYSIALCTGLKEQAENDPHFISVITGE